MREVATFVVALLLGLILGGLGPRAELKRMMQVVSQVDAERCKNSFGSDLALLLGQGPGGEPRPPGQERPRRRGGLSAERAASGAPPAGPSADATPDPEVEAALEEIEASEDLAESEVRADLDAALADEEGLAVARAALELRRTQARQALVEDAEPSGDQLAEIDGAYQEMNGTLRGLADAFAAVVAEGRQPSRKEAMEFAADALDAMLVAEDRVLLSLDEEQRSGLEEDPANPFNHVDPAIIDALQALDRSP